ncbi:MAG: hypothetical protein Q9222_003440 [Ikaeria aurantiellina]
MSEYATQLAIVLVNEIYGDLPSQVFGALAFHGRLAFPGLLHHTRCSSTEIRHSLVVLTQQHLVLWSDTDDSGQAIFEADLTNAYALARSGNYVRLTKKQRGDFAGDIISKINILGHVRVADLIKTKSGRPDEPPAFEEFLGHDSYLQANEDFTNMSNGSISRDHSDTEFRTTIGELLSGRLLCRLHDSYVRPAADNLIEAERVVPRDTSFQHKKQEQAVWELAVVKKLEDWKYGSKGELKALSACAKGTKRTFEEADGPSNTKKRKLIDSPLDVLAVTSGSAHSAVGAWSNDDIVLRINHEQFAIIMRNQQLVQLAEESIGPATSHVYAELLQVAEPQLRKCKDEFNTVYEDDEVDIKDMPQVSTEELISFSQTNPNLSDSLGHADLRKIKLDFLDHPKKVKRRRQSEDSDSNEAQVEGAASPDEDEGASDDTSSDMEAIDHDSDSIKANAEYSPHTSKHKTPDTTPDSTPNTINSKSPDNILRQHLLLLAEHPNRFLIPVPRASSPVEKWAIPYHSLSKVLLHNALVSITTSRFGPLAGRLIRILSTHASTDSDINPKLDEKMLVILSLIPQKQMRTLLHSMHRAGHIELQEIPKDGNQRRPGTTMFFWFFDAERARRRMLEECYRSMTRLVQRARVEREGVKGVVEKSERTDVVGREEEFLAEEELEALREWREKEERIWGEVGRLDGLVAVLRDF